MQQAAQNVDVLGNNENIKILANVLKTNVAACTSIGSFFLPQLGRIFMDMLGLYKAVSTIISETVAREGMFLFIHRNHFKIPNCPVHRFDFDEDTENPSIAHSKEGSIEINGNIHQAC